MHKGSPSAQRLAECTKAHLSGAPLHYAFYGTLNFFCQATTSKESSSLGIAQLSKFGCHEHGNSHKASLYSPRQPFNRWRATALICHCSLEWHMLARSLCFMPPHHTTRNEGNPNGDWVTYCRATWQTSKQTR